MLIKLRIHIVKVYSLDVNLVDVLVNWVSRCNSHVSSLLETWIGFVGDAFGEARLSSFAIETVINTETSLFDSEFNINSSTIKTV